MAFYCRGQSYESPIRYAFVPHSPVDRVHSLSPLYLLAHQLACSLLPVLFSSLFLSFVCPTGGGQGTFRLLFLEWRGRSACTRRFYVSFVFLSFQLEVETVLGKMGKGRPLMPRLRLLLGPAVVVAERKRLGKKMAKQQEEKSCNP